MDGVELLSRQAKLFAMEPLNPIVSHAEEKEPPEQRHSLAILLGS
jgi:hypothetical protein